MTSPRFDILAQMTTWAKRQYVKHVATLSSKPPARAKKPAKAMRQCQTF